MSAPLSHGISRRWFLRTTLAASAAAGTRAVWAEDAPPIKPFPRALVQTVYTRAIWADGGHNGFPGIARVGDYYYVTFRHAESHQDTSAKIYVIRARFDDLTKWDKVAEFTRDHDCRDPLIFDNHGQAQVVFHSQEDFFSQSADGVTWSEPRELETEFVEPSAASRLVFSSQRRWLFRIRRGPDGAFYSLARCGLTTKESHGTFGLILYRSEDGVKFKPLHTYGEGPTSIVSQDKRGWGHESDVAWTPDGTLVCAIRNSHDGVVVMGAAPNGPWKLFPTGACNFGGPALHTTKHGGLLLAARALPEKSALGFPAVCQVWTVTAEGLENPYIIPSGGDCAYQSFADGPGEEVLLAYYSSHEYPQPKGVGNNPTNVYLAHLQIRHKD